MTKYLLVFLSAMAMVSLVLVISNLLISFVVWDTFILGIFFDQEALAGFFRLSVLVSSLATLGYYLENRGKK